MKSEDDVDEYRRRLYYKRVLMCPKCAGDSPRCSCHESYETTLAAYEACIPRQFRGMKAEDIEGNSRAYQSICQYVKNIRVAHKHGYGLILCGDNGTGKTMLCSHLLMCAMRAGRTAYYTTAPQLDLDHKEGFGDAEKARRLSYMLTSDFVVIDELGKERAKHSNKYMDAQMERLIKQRVDNAWPTILATNLQLLELQQAYGDTVKSMLTGKFYVIRTQPGDYRLKQRADMVREMGYDADPEAGPGV